MEIKDVASVSLAVNHIKVEVRVTLIYRDKVCI